jgi:two-component system, OmpR family, response regulator VicR
MNRKILVVEDDKVSREVLYTALDNEGYDVVEAVDGEEALQKIESERPDLILLDLMLPRGMDGLDVCKRARDKTSVPIIMLTARNEEIDKVLGLEVGADDYITKPYGTRELLARIKAALRRARELAQPVSRTDDLVVGEVIISPAKREVLLRGEPVYLTPKEFDLLCMLARNADRVLTRAELLAEVWGYEGMDTRSLDVHIGRLRAKLEDDAGHPKIIVTARSVGYRMVKPPT